MFLLSRKFLPTLSLCQIPIFRYVNDLRGRLLVTLALVRPQHPSTSSNLACLARTRLPKTHGQIESWSYMPVDGLVGRYERGLVEWNGKGNIQKHLQ